MNKVLLGLAIFISISGRTVLASRPGIMLRLTGEVVEASYQGKMPEVRVYSDGIVVAGECSAKDDTCDLTRVDRLSRYEHRKVSLAIQRAAQVKPVRWISGAFCLRAPDFMNVYSASNGSVLLRDGDICLSGGMENPTRAGKALVALLNEYADEIRN